MKRTMRFAAMAMAMAATLGISGGAQAQDQGSGAKPASSPDWYFSIAALGLLRSVPGGGAIVAANPGGTPFLTGDDFSFGLAGGVDAAIGFKAFGDDVIEARLMYSEMGTTNTMTTPGGFIGAGFTGPTGTVFVSDYDTTFASGEINWRHSYSERLTVLGGLRGFEINDSLRSVLNNNVATGFYEAENALLGVQVGAQMSLTDASKPLQVELSGKVGVFNNKSSAGISEFQGNNPIGGFRSGDVQATSYAAELGLLASYKLSERSRLTFGYQVIWANNLALASNAASGSLLNPSLLTGTVFRDELLLHGVTIGFQMQF